MRSFPDTRSIEYLQRLGANVLVIHELRAGSDKYGQALERLARDPKIEVIGTGQDSGGRIAFFRLAPGP